MHDFLEKTFRLSESHPTIPTEILAGVTTFMTMSYIIFVQPAVLSTTGMDFQAVLAYHARRSGVERIPRRQSRDTGFAWRPSSSFRLDERNGNRHYIRVAGPPFAGRDPCRNCDEHGFGTFLWYRALSRHLQLSTLHYACCTEARRRRSLQAWSNSGNFHFFLSRSLRQHWIVDRHCGTGGIYP